MKNLFDWAGGGKKVIQGIFHKGPERWKEESPLTENILSLGKP